MPDTIRTKTALTTLLADNTVGAITPQTIRDLLVSKMGVYGELYVSSGSATQEIGTAATKLACFTSDGQADGLTADEADDDLTIPTGGDGIYRISTNISFSAGTTESILTITAFKNSATTLTNICAAISLGTSTTQNYALTAQGFASLVAAETVEIRASASATVTITVIQGNFNMGRLG